MQRRSLFKLGIVSAAAVAVMGGGAALLVEPAWRDGRLTESGRRVFAAVARAVLDGSLPSEDKKAQAAALAAHLDRMDAALSTMPASTQREVGDLLTLLALPPGRLALAGPMTDWQHAEMTQVQARLQAMRISSLSLRRKAYHALRDLTHAAYFASSSTWPQLGYPGPTKIE